jgi:hypothetical protein
VNDVDVEALAVYTNNPPCGAMRGFGANQSAFAIETCLDMLAERVGLDGWEMRYRNILRVGDTFRHRAKAGQAFWFGGNAAGGEGSVSRGASSRGSPAASRTWVSATACPI